MILVCPFLIDVFGVQLFTLSYKPYDYFLRTESLDFEETFICEEKPWPLWEKPVFSLINEPLKPTIFNNLNAVLTNQTKRVS